jgi:hypothetical protein
MAATSIAAALAAVASAEAAGDVAWLSRLLAAHGAAHARVADKALTALLDRADKQLKRTPGSGLPYLLVPQRRVLIQGCERVLHAYPDSEELVEMVFTILTHAVRTIDGLLPAAERSVIAADGQLALQCCGTTSAAMT